MSETNAETVWLTQEAHDKLEAELTHLKTVGRPEVTARIAAAREEGDLSENGGYHAAREEQGQMEGRIRQLEHLLRRAQVGEAQGDPDEVSPGRIVTVAFFGDVTTRIPSCSGPGRFSAPIPPWIRPSPHSRRGAAVLGHRVGDEVSYAAPNGRTIR